jgi:hypothetical protein
MTTPDERTRSVMQTRLFLEELCTGARTSGVPEEIRREARRLLRHYPDAGHLDHAAVAWPGTWAPTRTGHEGAPSYLELLARLRELHEPPPVSEQGPDES